MTHETDELADILTGVRIHARRGGVTGDRAWSGGRERRAEPLEVTRPGLGPESSTLQILPMRALDDIVPALRDLEADPIEPNICFGAEIMQATYPRLARDSDRGALRIACLWYRSGIEGDPPRLDLFAPVSIDRAGWPGRDVLRIASNEFLPVGVPLVRREGARETLRLFLDLLASPDIALPSVLLMPDQRMDGPVAVAIEAAGKRVRRVGEHERAVIRARLNGTSRTAIGLSAKRERNLARQRRRLQEQGALEHRIARTPSDIVDAMEAFVALELASWKGERGTALYSVRSVLAYARECVANLARTDRAQIHSLTLDGVAIASLIVLGSGADRITWKVAFDAAHAANSPGVQLLLDATRTFMEAGDGVDSIAVADHPVMDRLWTGRRSMADLVVALDDDPYPIVKVCDALERRRSWRGAAKSLLRRTGLRRR